MCWNITSVLHWLTGPVEKVTGHRRVHDTGTLNFGAMDTTARLVHFMAKVTSIFLVHCLKNKINNHKNIRIVIFHFKF